MDIKLRDIEKTILQQQQENSHVVDDPKLIPLMVLDEKLQTGNQTKVNVEDSNKLLSSSKIDTKKLDNADQVQTAINEEGSNNGKKGIKKHVLTAKFIG